MKTWYTSDDAERGSAVAADIEQYEADLAAAKSPVAWLDLPWGHASRSPRLPTSRVMNLLPDLFALFHTAKEVAEDYNARDCWRVVSPEIWDLEAKYLEAVRQPASERGES